MHEFETVRNAVKASLKENFPRLRSVKTHGGPIDLKEIARFNFRSPEARVAWIGTMVSRDKIQRATGESTYAVYVICKDRPRKPAPDQVMNWASQITKFLDGNKFGLNFINSARVHSVINPYNSEQDVQGIAFVEIRFECPMILEVEGLGSEDSEEFTDEQREITILKQTLLPAPLGSVQPALGRTEIHTATATVKTVGGLSEVDQVATSDKSVTHEFTIPYVNLEIDSTCRVRMGEIILDIEEVENVNEQNRELVLRCIALGSESRKAN